MKAQTAQTRTAAAEAAAREASEAREQTALAEADAARAAEQATERGAGATHLGRHAGETAAAPDRPHQG